MADASKLKSLKTTLGKAPKIEEASENTQAPETAPSNDYGNHYKRVDWRTMRRTNRVVRLGLSVTPEFDYMLRTIAMERNMLLVEVLEEAIKLYGQKTSGNI